MFAVTILCGRYPKATELNLRGCPCVDEVLVQEAMLSLRLVLLLLYFVLVLQTGFRLVVVIPLFLLAFHIYWILY
jgi:hypothetical protein